MDMTLARIAQEGSYIERKYIADRARKKEQARIDGIQAAIKYEAELEERRETRKNIILACVVMALLAVSCLI